MSRSRAVILLSGGVDSATAAFHYQKRLGVQCDALTVLSRANHSNSREVESARIIASALDVSHTVVDLTNLNTVFLNPKTVLAVGGQSGGCCPVQRRGVSLGVELMHMVAFMYAAERGICRVVWSIHLDDLTELATKESVATYAHNLADLVSDRTGQPSVLELPFLDKTKAQVIVYGSQLGVPIDKTFSCSSPVNGQACQTCKQCQLRASSMVAV